MNAVNETSPKVFRLPKTATKWVAVGLILSSAIVIIIAVFSGVTLTDLAKLGYLPFAAAAAVSSSRLLVQVVRFRVVTRGLAEIPRLDLGGSAVVRMGSEFVALSTPSAIGGPVLRAAWLSQKGVKAGTSLWIGYFEILMDVYVGSVLGLISAWYAFSRGAVLIGSAIALVATLLMIGYTLLFIVPALRNMKVPHRVFRLAAFLMGGPRAERLFLRAVVSSLNFSITARSILKKDSIPLILKTAALTLLDAILLGAALWIIIVAAGLNIDLFSATVMAFGVLTIAAIPISIGGAGLTELTLQAYLSSVYGFSSWAAVVFWRIASFHVVLAVSGVAFLSLIRGATRTDVDDLAVLEEVELNDKG